MKRLILPALCALMMAGCQTAAKLSAPVASDAPKNAIEITGSASTTMTTTPILPDDPNITVYPLEGPIQNPMVTDRTHSVLDNTTSGGYTVFDESVTVYPLPGDDVPPYMPKYSVPPLKGQYKEDKSVGQKPMGLASAGILPPVPNVDVVDPDAAYKPPVKHPLNIKAPQPLTMQPPVSETPAPRSPFAEPGMAKGKPMSLTGYDDAAATPEAAAPAPVVASPSIAMTAGRKSAPMLTGY